MNDRRPAIRLAAAAQRGWEDGQRDAREAKEAYWRRRTATAAPARGALEAVFV